MRRIVTMAKKYYFTSLLETTRSTTISQTGLTMLEMTSIRMTA